MGRFTMAHEVSTDEAGFWALFLDDELSKQVFVGEVGYHRWEVADRSGSGQDTKRTVAFDPARSWPGPVRKLFGSSYGETEKAGFAAPGVWTWARTPSVQSDKIRMEGALRVEPVAGGRCRAVAEVAVEARIFGVGGLLESSLEKAFREDQNRLVAAYNRRLR
ncbi:DUF2505 family protein [Allokutzneria oryzae]|uniref:DUF2505 family protein n=1 Tax=Allokutzneria oryzae TaxID=1378989 RepID=A0ABV5ZR93_9PSEU